MTVLRICVCTKTDQNPVIDSYTVLDKICVGMNFVRSRKNSITYKEEPLLQQPPWWLPVSMAGIYSIGRK